MVYIYYIGIELEFYLLGESRTVSWVLKNCVDNFKNVSIKEEEEPGQYEVIIAHDRIDLIALRLNSVRDFLLHQAYLHNLQILFHPKPFIDRAGSALHININVQDGLGNNLFDAGEHVQSNNPLLWCVQALLHDISPNASVFFPTPSSYLRVIHPNMHTPTHIAWGIGNRTTSIRIPSAYIPRRIEHRVSGSNCVIEEVLGCIEISLDRAFIQQQLPPKPVWGVARDYDLITLASLRLL